MARPVSAYATSARHSIGVRERTAGVEGIGTSYRVVSYVLEDTTAVLEPQRCLTSAVAFAPELTAVVDHVGSDGGSLREKSNTPVQGQEGV